MNSTASAACVKPPKAAEWVVDLLQKAKARLAVKREVPRPRKLSARRAGPGALLFILWEVGLRFGLFSKSRRRRPLLPPSGGLLAADAAGARSEHLAWLDFRRTAVRCLFQLVPRHRGFPRWGLAPPLGLMGASPRTYDLFNLLMQILRPIPPIAYISAGDPVVRSG